MDDGLAGFNAAPVGVVRRALLECCASPDWAQEIAAGRPYAEVGSLTTAADAALAKLDWLQVALALSAHPRIGERPVGAGREAAWSRREQAGVDDAAPDTLAELAAANLAYEERFGQVFLIFASGRTDAEMLAAAQARLANDEETERAVVREELSRIVKLRLTRMLSE